MPQKLFYIRYFLIIVVIFLLISSLAFIGLGVVHSIEGYKILLGFNPGPELETRPGIYLLEGLDTFMAGIVFMIFAFGIARLFLFDHVEDDKLPKWLNIHNFKELKILLWETILVTLVVYTLGDLVKTTAATLELLYLPVVILILSLSLFLMRLKEHK
jgi:uncharacterized membrane protein YqhA